VREFVRTWLFPPACVACDAPGPALCAACGPPARDALTFAVGGIPAFALGDYEGALRRAIVAMKNGERDPLDAFAALLAARAPLDGAVIPLPTTQGRILDRGFDQSVELGRRLAALRGVACAEVLEKRGAPQAGRNRRDRLAAPGRFRLRRGSVQLEGTAAPATALPAVATLLDDVCTTGATVRDAARVLREAGVEVRRIVVLARTAEPHAAGGGTNGGRGGSMTTR
jgi:predicted amidophosphoribosyltransferase